MAKDTVEKKDETVVLEKRVTRLEAILRILSKEVKEHFGIDVAVAILFAMFASSALAADTTIVDWGTGVSGGIGTAKITSDGTVATLTVDKIVSTGSAQTVSNLTVQGTLGVTGASTLTGGATAKGRAVVTSASTTDTMVQGYTCSSVAQLNSTIITQAFSTVFTTVPAVTFSMPTNELNCAITTLTTNSVTIGPLSTTNITIRIIAVGAKSN